MSQKVLGSREIKSKEAEKSNKKKSQQIARNNVSEYRIDIVNQTRVVYQLIRQNRQIGNYFVALLKVRDGLEELLLTNRHYRLGRRPPARDIRPLRPRRRFVPVPCG